ncbi:MAG: zf-TFIIB domain-containing protein [Chloroflexota bacterium]
MEMRITDRQGIEIDYCPQCRGIWLDRGELDKLIERTAGLMQEPGTEVDHRHTYVGKKKRGHFYEADEDYYDDDYRHTYAGKKKPGKYSKYGGDRHYRKRRENKITDFFEDIFDIF